MHDIRGAREVLINEATDTTMLFPKKQIRRQTATIPAETLLEQSAMPIDFRPVYANQDLARALNDLERSLSLSDEEIRYRTLVNTSVSRTQPFHRWARYREGYSGDLVKELIARDNLDAERQFVFDPMCGSGSTLVAAAEMGFDCLGLDVNPYSVDLSNAKIRHYGIDSLNAIRAFSIGIRSSQRTPAPNSKWNDAMKSAIPYFDQGHIEQLQDIRGEIELVDDVLAKEFLFVMWLSILEDCSNKKKDGNGLASRPTRVRDVRKYLCDQIDLAYDDLTRFALPTHTASIALVESALNSHDAIAAFCERTGKKLGAVIFSPPYANSFDYIESYKLELLLGSYSDSAGLSELRKGAIRNYRKGYGFQLECSNSLVKLICEEVRTNIPKKEAKSGKQDGRTRLVPNLLIGYFKDMEEVISVMASYMPRDSMCHIVVDQSAYVGVIVPTDLLFVEIGRRYGLETTQLTRCRRANTSGQQMAEYPYLRTMLRESIVSMRKVR